MKKLFLILFLLISFHIFENVEVNAQVFAPGFYIEGDDGLGGGDDQDDNYNTDLKLVRTGFVSTINDTVPNETPFTNYLPEIELYLPLSDLQGNFFIKDQITQFYGKIINTSTELDNRFFRVIFLSSYYDIPEDSPYLYFTKLDDVYYTHTNTGNFYSTEVLNVIDVSNEYDIYENYGYSQTYMGTVFLGSLTLFYKVNSDTWVFLIAEKNPYIYSFVGGFYLVETNILSIYDLPEMNYANIENSSSFNTTYYENWPSKLLDKLIFMDFQ